MSHGTYQSVVQETPTADKPQSKSRPLAKEKRRKSVPGKETQPTSPSGTKLRTASRQRLSQAGQTQKPGESAEHQLARTTHNKVEKAYRERLNREFRLLVAVIPPIDAGRQASKADVVGTSTSEIASLASDIVELREKKRQKDEKKKGKKKSHP